MLPHDLLPESLVYAVCTKGQSFIFLTVPSLVCLFMLTNLHLQSKKKKGDLLLRVRLD